MGNIKIDIVNREALTEAVKDLDAIGMLGVKGPAALRAGAAVLLPAVTEAAPVRTGRLKGAMKVQGKGMNVKVGAFHNDAPHAHLVEYGHGGPKPAPPHPFVQTTADMMEADVLDAIMEELTRGTGL